MLDLDELEAKAKAAQESRPGEWRYDRGFEKLDAGAIAIADVWDDACGEFIAAANPGVILALIRELREARASRAEMLARLQEEAKLHVNFMLGEHAKVVTERDEARAAVAAEREAIMAVIDAKLSAAADFGVNGTLMHGYVASAFAQVLCSIKDAIRARGERGKL